MYERHCEICGSADASVVDSYTDKTWPLVQCSSCGFVYLGKVPGYEALIEEFAWEESHKAENEKRVRRLDGKFDTLTRWRLGLGKVLDAIGQNNALNVSGNVLDIGCGGGCRIPPGPTPFGIEISAQLADQGAVSFEERGGSLHHGPAIEGLDGFPGVEFNAILMRSYLEHEEQPRKVLEKSFARLKPAGQIYLRLPNYGSPNRYVMGRRWCGFRFPDHVNYFNGKTLQALANDIGFKYRQTNAWSIFDDNLHVVLTKP